MILGAEPILSEIIGACGVSLAKTAAAGSRLRTLALPARGLLD